MSLGFPDTKIMETEDYTIFVPICFIYSLMKYEQRNWLISNVEVDKWKLCSLGRQQSLKLGYGSEMKCVAFKNPLDALAFKLRFDIPGVP